jgi:hypothetical protein
LVLKDNKGGLEMNRRIKVYESNIDGVDDVCWIRIGGRQYFISGLGTDKQDFIEVEDRVGVGMRVVLNTFMWM